MNKPLYLLAMAVMSVIGCRQRENLVQLKAIGQSLQKSNSIIQEDNKLVQEALFEKRRDPRYSSDGEIWEPKASRIKAQADSIVAFIEELKSELIKQSDSLKEEKAPLIEQLYTTDGSGYKLVNKLAAFKDSFSAIIHVEDFVDNPVKHASLKEDIPHLYSTVPLLQGYSGSLNAAQRKDYTKRLLDDNFSGTSAVMAMVVLNRMENDLLITTKALMEFCLNQTAVLICGWPGEFRTIAALNSSYVKQGQPIEVTAGVGQFSAAMKPRITIDGKVIKMNDYATAVHSFPATGKPGEHSVDVKIEYYRPDGVELRVTKTLKYIIADEK